MTTRSQNLGYELEAMVLDKIDSYKKNTDCLKLCLADLANLLNEPEFKKDFNKKYKYAQLLIGACGMDFKMIWDVAIALKAGKIPHYGEERQKELEVALKLINALTPAGRDQLVALVEQKIGKVNAEDPAEIH